MFTFPVLPSSFQLHLKRSFLGFVFRSFLLLLVNSVFKGATGIKVYHYYYEIDCILYVIHSTIQTGWDLSSLYY